MKYGYEKHPLDMPDLDGLVLSDDVRVLGTIIKEHGLTKATISKLTGLSYKKVLKVITELSKEEKVVERVEYFSKIKLYQPTKFGVYYAQSELNCEYFYDLKEYLEKQGYAKKSINAFLLDKFYEYYTIGKFSVETLASDFEDWCLINDKNPGETPIRKLKNK